MKWGIIFLILAVSACGGGGSSSNGGPPADPVAADVSGVWHGEIDGNPATLFIDKTGEIWGSGRLVSLNHHATTFQGSVRMSTRFYVSIESCEHLPSELDEATHSMTGSCGYASLDASVVEGQTISGKVSDDYIVDLSSDEAGSPVPESGCGEYWYNYYQITSFDQFGYPIYTNVHLRLNVHEDGALSGRESYQRTGQTSPDYYFDISGSVVPNEVDGFPPTVTLEKTLSSTGRKSTEEGYFVNSVLYAQDNDAISKLRNVYQLEYMGDCR